MTRAELDEALASLREAVPEKHRLLVETAGFTGTGR
jgi:hypothetical protein